MSKLDDGEDYLTPESELHARHPAGPGIRIKAVESRLGDLGFASMLNSVAIVLIGLLIFKLIKQVGALESAGG